MISILMSIKPKYANQIFDGTKLFEFRKKIPTKYTMERVIVYSSSPVKRVIGEFVAGDIYYDSPSNLWSRYGINYGTSKADLMEYFEKHDKGYAIEVINPVLYDKAHLLHDAVGIKTPPQSWRYICDHALSVDLAKDGKLICI